MKREFLQNIKIGDQPLTKEIIDAIMAENGNDIEAAKKPFADYEDIKGQLSEASKTIEEFKGMDIDGIKKTADEWKKKAEQAEKDAAAKIADMEFSGLLDTAITTAKGRNAKALRGLLDMDTLKASKNRSEDIKSALEALKTSDGYLFEDAQAPPPYAGGPGSAPIGKKTSEMNYSELSAYMAANPGAQI
ncbi:phage scaffolding protein [Oscillibacter sp.]|uniref:phage scaffolding protein n=1 Tax=Oscillibacter sp. TaxID=1945593 RepID=UPI00289D01AD|nr:phage scaffolding protein [Oscillibacter sp.]